MLHDARYLSVKAIDASFLLIDGKKSRFILLREKSA